MDAGGDRGRGLPPPVLVTPPAALPLTLAAAKRHLRVDHPDEDEGVLRTIEAAVSHLDGWTGVLGRALITQTWRQDFPCWADLLPLRLAPVQSAAVEYDDADGVATALDPALWTLGADRRDPAILRKPAAEYPALGETPWPVRVTFVAGYGLASAVPPGLRHALLLLVGGMHEYREETIRGTKVAENPAFLNLIRPFRRVL